MALIDISALSFTTGGKTILRDINFNVDEGERIAILGGNGSGKTSLARLIAGWSMAGEPHGQVLYRKRPWSEWTVIERAAAIQLVGQIPAQHLSGRAFTVLEEVAFGPENLGLSPEDIRRRVDFAITVTNLGGLVERNPFTLSGGEQQRLVIAASLALDPKVLVLDEPFTNLDPESRDAMLDVLRGLPETLTIIIMETSPGLAAALARRFLFLENGMIAAQGNARDVLTDPDLIARLGLPPVARAVRELEDRSGQLFDHLPLVPGDLLRVAERIHADN